VTSSWPALNYDEWSETCDTLHAHTQILGKLAVALASPEPELQHAALRLTARGWETAPLPAPNGSGALVIALDLRNHEAVVEHLMLRFNNQGVPAWEDRMMRVGWPLAVRYAQRELGIRPGVEVEDEASVFRELDFVAGLLDGRKHLCGDRFSAADLTFAALSASVSVPPVYGVSLPQPDALPPQTAELVERGRHHPAGRYALAMFGGAPPRGGH
jgi:hypothetical protein